jgi:hypothetical protein
MLRLAKNIFCTAKSMVATYPPWVWGEGEEDQILAALKTDLGDPGKVWLPPPSPMPMVL